MPSTAHRLALFLALVSHAWSLCPAGHVWQGSNRCLPCALGTFSTGGLASTCTPCPDGSTSLHVGAASQLECLYCRDGFAYTPHAESRCTLCRVSGKGNTAHQRRQCELEPFGGKTHLYREWGFSNIDRALQEIQGDRGMIQLLQDVDRENFKNGELLFVHNLTQSPTAQTPRPGLATVQDFYQTQAGGIFVRQNISAGSFCHAYNVWDQEENIKDICFERGTDQNTPSRSVLAALRSENYCSMRATRQPFVVHLLPVHRARVQVTPFDDDCGFVLESDANARMLQDFPIEGRHIHNSLKYYDLRRFMYQRYIAILDAKLRDKTSPPSEESQPPLEKVLGFAPALRVLIHNSEFRPGCRDDNLYANYSKKNLCNSDEIFHDAYDTCEEIPLKPNSVLHFLHKQMHCPVANSTQELLQKVVDSAVAAVNLSTPTFVDDPEIVAIDNPCEQSTAAAQVSINGGPWHPIANFSEAHDVLWQGSPQTLHVTVKTVDKECAFEASVAVNATQRGIAFVEKRAGGECDADMEHAREFGVALQRFDALVAVA